MDKNRVISRRSFMRKGVVVTGLLVASTLFCNPRQQDTDKWDFLEKEIELPVITPNVVISKYVPLHKKNDFIKSGDEQDVREIKAKVEPLIRKRIEELGFDGRDDYTTNSVVQAYGVPENPKDAKTILEYCKQAEELLYESLPNLKWHPVDWRIIKEGDDFSQEYNGKGLIGKLSYDIITFDVANKKDSNQSFPLLISKPWHGSFALPYDNDDGSLHSWMIFIASGNLVLASPFSEFIPLATHLVDLEYLKKVGAKKARLAIEAYSEAVANSCALDLASRLKIPNAKRVMQRANQNMGREVYDYVPAAMEWVNKYGSQKATELYLDDPQKFMDAIKS